MQNLKATIFYFEQNVWKFFEIITKCINFAAKSDVEVLV